MALTRFEGCARLVNVSNGKAMYPGWDGGLRLRSATDAKEEVWSIQPAGQGLFKLLSANTGQAITRTAQGPKLAPLSQQDQTQLWALVAVGSNAYRFDQPLPGEVPPGQTPSTGSLTRNAGDEVWLPRTFTGQPLIVLSHSVLSLIMPYLLRNAI